jgi:hypothetical protein
MRAMPSPGIKEALRAYTTGEAADWELTTLAAGLHEWAQRLNRTFALNIDTPVLQLQRLQGRSRGSYRPGRNALGLVHQITFKTFYRDAAPAVQIAALFREVLHEWQSLHGTPGRWHHHNRQFRDKARGLGVEFDRNGRFVGINQGPFTNLLDEHGVDWAVLRQGQGAWPEGPGSGRMKKWSCGCTNIRAAVAVQALCQRCGRPFAPAARSSGRGVTASRFN